MTGNVIGAIGGTAAATPTPGTDDNTPGSAGSCAGGINSSGSCMPGTPPPGPPHGASMAPPPPAPPPGLGAGWPTGGGQGHQGGSHGGRSGMPGPQPASPFESAELPEPSQPHPWPRFSGQVAVADGIEGVAELVGLGFPLLGFPLGSTSSAGS